MVVFIHVIVNNVNSNNEGLHGSMHFQTGVWVALKLVRCMNAIPHVGHTSHLVDMLACQTFSTATTDTGVACPKTEMKYFRICAPAWKR